MDTADKIELIRRMMSTHFEADRGGDADAECLDMIYEVAIFDAEYEDAEAAR